MTRAVTRVFLSGLLASIAVNQWWGAGRPERIIYLSSSHHLVPDGHFHAFFFLLFLLSLFSPLPVFTQFLPEAAMKTPLLRELWRQRRTGWNEEQNRFAGSLVSERGRRGQNNVADMNRKGTCLCSRIFIILNFLAAKWNKHAQLIMMCLPATVQWYCWF